MSRQEYEAYVSDQDRSEFGFTDLDDPIPEGLPKPGLYRMFLMPVGIKRELKVKGTKKTILLPDESIDAAKWLNAIGRVCGLGAACFQHPRYSEMNMMPEDFPKVGDLILYTARSPLRFHFKGTPIIVINDDQWFAKVEDESTVAHFKFYV